MNPAVTLVVLRESLEALLILGILTAIVMKAGERGALRWVYAGAAAGLLAAFAGGAVIYTLPDLLSDEMLTWFAVLAPLVAAILIVQVIWGMRHQMRANGKRLAEKVQAHLTTEDRVGLAVASFLAIGREGFETVLFLGGDILAARGTAPVTLLASAGAGFLVAFMCYKVFQTSLRQFGLTWFFRVTMVLLLFTAGYLLIDSYHHAASAGFV